MCQFMAADPFAVTAPCAGGFSIFAYGTAVQLLDEMTSMTYNGSMTKKRTDSLSDQLRRAVDESGLTRYQIAKETGIDESALAKFYNGHRGLSMKALNSLGELLQLKITSGRK